MSWWIKTLCVASWWILRHFGVSSLCLGAIWGAACTSKSGLFRVVSSAGIQDTFGPVNGGCHRIEVLLCTASPRVSKAALDNVLREESLLVRFLQHLQLLLFSHRHESTDANDSTWWLSPLSWKKKNLSVSDEPYFNYVRRPTHVLVKPLSGQALEVTGTSLRKSCFVQQVG